MKTPIRLTANAVQIGGDHYKNKDIQPWDAILAWSCGFLDGNVIKYVSRYRSKNGLEDLKKARHYLDKLIEVETENQTCQTATQGTQPKQHVQLNFAASPSTKSSKRKGSARRSTTKRSKN